MRAAGLEWRDYDRFMQKFVNASAMNALARYPVTSTRSPIATNTMTTY